MLLGRKREKQNPGRETKPKSQNIAATPGGSERKRLVRLPSLSRKKKLGLVSLTVLVLIAAGSYSYLNNKDKTSTSESTAKQTLACTDSPEILTEAAKAIEASDANKLGQLVEKISAAEGYEQDPGCLNIITTYYILISDSENARANLDKLEKVYDDEVGFGPLNISYVKDIKTLRSDVEFLEEQARQYQKLSPSGAPQ